jgi:hypothetical protein
MRRYVCVGLAVALVGITRPSSAEESPQPDDRRPSSGLDLLGGGIALTAIGALSFATAPICETSVVIAREQSSCFAVSFVIGAPSLVAGISLIAIGVVQHTKYNQWMRRHPALQGLTFASTSRGGIFGYGVSF